MENNSEMISDSEIFFGFFRHYIFIFLLRILPAVHNNRASIGWIDSLDLLEEFQHADGREWHPEVWPAGEVKLGDQAGSSETIVALL